MRDIRLALIGGFGLIFIPVIGFVLVIGAIALLVYGISSFLRHFLGLLLHGHYFMFGFESAILLVLLALGMSVYLYFSDWGRVILRISKAEIE
ncbi:hypothetical protein CMALT430_490014 [Carnobacterium maltaromaticum]|uniref:hypothetical protein n=1 Tax=Carnobacterium maltaromaticum TaxID=2751 RepID=UPI00191BC742|nr:hypothetical protein [Carnobacterium maltaromaticum]CAD5901332.1 hypothetical protein CMALT430_490014 [Carnobacterium maltaromaticum]